MRKMEYKNFLRLNVLGFFAAFVIVSIILIAYAEFGKIDMFVYVYTITTVVFQMSLITGAFFYRHDYRWKNNGYEPTVSFIIPAKNEEKVIAKTIQKCYDVEYPKNKIDVLVINDGSTDNTFNEIERMKKIYPELTVINWKRNRGKKYAMVEAFRKAKGYIVVQLDSDSYLEKSSLKTLVTPFQDPNIAGIAAHTDPENKDENLMTRIQSAYYFISFRTLKAAESLFDMVFCCSGCCSAYRKDVILPLLDEWIKETFMSKPTMWDDDRSLTNLVLRSGYRTIYLSNVQAYTVVPNSFKWFIKQQVRWKKCWIVSSVNTFKFIFKKDMFVGVIYFVPMTLITILAPIVAFNALVIDPLIYGIYPTVYISGIFLVTAFLALQYQFFRDDKYWKYIFLFTILDIVLLSYIMFYALIDIRNVKWGTR